jgi:hypothetical protein
MPGRRLLSIGLIGAVLLAGMATLNRAEAGTKKSLKKLGFRAYWSLLDAGQRQEARKLVVENLIGTAADRLRCAARILEYRADVAEVLTPDQRRKIGKLRHVVRHLPEFRKRRLPSRFLGETDRELLAERIGKMAAAGPEERVDLGFLVHGQLHEAMISALEGRIELSEEQIGRLRDLYADLTEDLRPAAVRIETARQETVRKGLALLTERQREKLERIGKFISDRVLAFVRG